jgi:flagellin-like protein
MYKKGISPLIASVLLIGFTVALAVVVMTWGSGFVRDMTTSTERSAQSALKCTQLDFKITKLDCLGNKVTIENKGSIDIKSLSFRGYNSAGDVSKPTVGGTNTTVRVQDIKIFTVTMTGLNKLEAIASVPGDADSTVACSLVLSANC